MDVTDLRNGDDHVGLKPIWSKTLIFFPRPEGRGNIMIVTKAIYEVGLLIILVV